MFGIGLLAGAAGIVALDAFTYLDMAASGRPASEVPSKVVAALAEKIGDDSLAHSDEDEAKNRHSGFGALSGYGRGSGARASPTRCCGRRFAGCRGPSQA